MLFLVTIVTTYHLTAVNGLNKQVDKLADGLKVCEASNSKSNDALNTQTAYIIELEVDYKTNVQELEEWEALPPEIRYNTIYKYMPSEVIVERGDCNDTKNLIDSIRTIDFSKL